VTIATRSARRLNFAPAESPGTGTAVHSSVHRSSNPAVIQDITRNRGGVPKLATEVRQGFARLSAVLAATAVVLFALPAAAQVPDLGPPDPKVAEAELGRAAEAYRDARWNDAFESSRASWVAGGGIDALESMAASAVQAGRIAIAYELYETVNQTGGSRPGLVARARKQLDALRRQTAALKVRSSPVGARIYLGDELLGQTPLGRPLRAPPGKHVVTAEFGDGSNVKREVTLRLAVTSELEIAGPHPPVPTPSPPTAVTAAAKDEAQAPKAEPVAQVTEPRTTLRAPPERAVRIAVLTKSGTPDWLRRRIADAVGCRQNPTGQYADCEFRVQALGGAPPSWDEATCERESARDPSPETNAGYLCLSIPPESTNALPSAVFVRPRGAAIECPRDVAASGLDAVISWLRVRVAPILPQVVSTSVMLVAKSEGRVLVTQSDGESESARWAALPHSVPVLPTSRPRRFIFEVAGCHSPVAREIDVSVPGVHEVSCAARPSAAIRVVSPVSGATIIVAPDASMSVDPSGADVSFRRLSESERESTFAATPGTKLHVGCHYADGPAFTRRVVLNEESLALDVYCDYVPNGQMVMMRTTRSGTRIQLDGRWTQVRRIAAATPDVGSDPPTDALEPGQKYWIAAQPGAHVLQAVAPLTASADRRAMRLRSDGPMQTVDFVFVDTPPQDVVNRGALPQRPEPGGASRRRLWWAGALAGAGIGTAGGALWAVASYRQDRAAETLSAGQTSYIGARRATDAAEPWRQAGVAASIAGTAVLFGAALGAILD
jgi:hypothetical protein